MAKSIFSFMDTNGLRDYINSNLEMFGLETDADGNEIPARIAGAALEKVISSSTDGRLDSMIRESLDDWYGQQIYDRIYECIDTFVYDEANNVLKELYTQVFDMPPVKAEVDFEADGRNGYINFVRTETFDCELALDTFPLSELPPDHDGFSEDGACNYGDDVYFAAEELGLVDYWDGPFTFHIGDWKAYDRYIAARVRYEYGYELRS